jgi:hypothetical protein
VKLQKLQEKIKFNVHLCASFLLKFSVCETTQCDLALAAMTFVERRPGEYISFCVCNCSS